MSTIADRIEAGVRSLGLKEIDFAAKIGITKRQQLYQIKSGERPGRKWLPVIAEAFGCTVEWLVNGTGPAPRWAGMVAEARVQVRGTAALTADVPLIDELRSLYSRLGELIARYEEEHQVARAAEPVGDYRAASSELIRAGLTVPDPPVAKNTSDEESDTHLTPRR